MLSNCGARKDSWESLGQQRDHSSQSWRKSTLNIHWKNWCWSWSSNNLATWCEELTRWKRPWCRERLKAGGGWGNRGWDGWMASPARWSWVCVSSSSWWWKKQKERCPVLSQEAYHWRPKYTLELQFDGEPNSQRRDFKTMVMIWSSGKYSWYLKLSIPEPQRPIVH